MVYRSVLSFSILLLTMQPAAAMLSRSHASSFSHALLRHGNNKVVFSIGLGCSAIGAATYGIIKLRAWWTTRNDNYYLQQSRDCLDSVTLAFGGIVAEYEKLFANWHPGEDQLTQEQIQESFENKLRLLTQRYLFDRCTISDDNEVIDDYLRKLLQAITRLQESKNQLANRIISSSSRTYQLQNEMNGQRHEIEQWLKKLDVVHNLLYLHRSFFVLEQIQNVCNDRYNEELSFAPMLQNDQKELISRTHQAVMVYQSNCHDSFPYRCYLYRLANTIKKLRPSINAVERAYPHSFRWAQIKLTSLEAIRAVVASSPYYHSELGRAEESRLRDEATAVKRSKAFALERSAKAKEQQVLALRSQEAATRENTREMTRYRTALEEQTRAVGVFCSKYGHQDLKAVLRTLSALNTITPKY